MLYIQFKIQDPEKYSAFQELYQHMVKVRTPNFEFDNESSDIDWDTATEAEIDAFLFPEPDEPKRYKELFPAYANQFLERYIQGDSSEVEDMEEQTLSILNYLEFGFEVDMDNLEMQNDSTGLIKLSTGNYPFGGMDRFLMVLRAFDLIPLECYNGFTIYQFEWVSDFKHITTDLPEKTKEYLSR